MEVLLVLVALILFAFLTLPIVAVFRISHERPRRRRVPGHANK